MEVYSGQNVDLLQFQELLIKLDVVVVLVGVAGEHFPVPPDLPLLAVELVDKQPPAISLVVAKEPFELTPILESYDPSALLLVILPVALELVQIGVVVLANPMLFVVFPLSYINRVVLVELHSYSFSPVFYFLAKINFVFVF